MSTTIDPAADPFAALRPSEASTARSKADDPGSADRFLKMLVTQLQNQDPLNPMDNAQITSQIAQINTVAGLEKVNQSIQGLAVQLLQMQMLQGTALVGREIALPGEMLFPDQDKARGVVELLDPASSLRVDIFDAAGQVVDTLDLGPAEAGRTSFEWNLGDLPSDQAYRFAVSANRGGEVVSARTLTLDRVRSVSTAGEQLTLTLEHGGQASTSDIVAFH